MERAQSTVQNQFIVIGATTLFTSGSMQRRALHQELALMVRHHCRGRASKQMDETRGPLGVQNTMFNFNLMLLANLERVKFLLRQRVNSKAGNWEIARRVSIVALAALKAFRKNKSFPKN